MKIAVIVNNDEILNKFLEYKHFNILCNKGFLVYDLLYENNHLFLVKLSNDVIEISTAIAFLIMEYKIQFFIVSNICKSLLNKYCNCETIYSTKINFDNDHALKISNNLTKYFKNTFVCGLVSTISNIDNINILNNKTLAYDYNSYYVLKSAKYLNRNSISIITLYNKLNKKDIELATDKNINDIFRFIDTL